MKVILLTAIVFALVRGGHGVFSNGSSMTRDLAARPPKLEPCTLSTVQTVYDNFRHRHVITDVPNDNAAWGRYLQKEDLCGRARVQSFIDDKASAVRQICTSRGRRLKGAPADKGDFCMSKSEMDVYEVKSKRTSEGCEAEATLKKQQVIVRCMNIKKTCYPVHFEKNNGQQADNISCV